MACRRAPDRDRGRDRGDGAGGPKDLDLDPGLDLQRLRRIHPAALPRPFSKGLHAYEMIHYERYTVYRGFR